MAKAFKLIIFFLFPCRQSTPHPEIQRRNTENPKAFPAIDDAIKVRQFHKNEHGTNPVNIKERLLYEKPESPFKQQSF